MARLGSLNDPCADPIWSSKDSNLAILLFSRTEICMGVLHSRNDLAQHIPSTLSNAEHETEV